MINKSIALCYLLKYCELGVVIKNLNIDEIYVEDRERIIEAVFLDKIKVIENINKEKFIFLYKDHTYFFKEL